MIKLGKLALKGSPRIALSIKDRMATAALLKDAKKYGVHLIELRVDQFASCHIAYVLKEIKKFKGFTKIATIRSRKEGGKWNQSEKTRLELFKAVIPYVDAVDIELSSREILPAVVQETQRRKKTVMVSYHNFEKTPERSQLKAILSEAKKAKADIVKIASLVRKAEDIHRLAAFTISHAHQNVIVIGMGSFGASSRILFPVIGSLITYAFAGKPTAPGQLNYRTTSDLLKKLLPSRSVKG